MKIAMYQSTEYDWMKTVASVDDYSQRPDRWVLISNVVEIDFELIEDDASKLAIKALSIKAAQKKVAAANKALDELL